MTHSQVRLFAAMCTQALLIGATLGALNLPAAESMPVLVFGLGLHLLRLRSRRLPTPYPRRNKGVQL